MNGRSLAVNVARPREDRPAAPAVMVVVWSPPGGFDRDRGGNTMGNNFRPGRR